eukprot:197589_1
MSNTKRVIISLSVIAASYILYKLWKKWNNPEANIKIKSLYVYPVKSTQGFEVKKWKLSKYGMKYDREYLVYSPKTKSVITQRQVNLMALIKARLIFTNNDESNAVTGLQFSAPKMIDIFVPIADESIEQNQVKDIKWFMDKLTGTDQGDNISQWLTKYLNGNSDKKEKEYRLMRVSSKYYRGLNNSETSDEIVILNKNVPKELMNTALAPYSDAYPLLIVSNSSFNEVNKRLRNNNCDTIEINRFRPNIVIESDLNEPFIEDRIDTLIHHYNDKTTFYLRAPCPRCLMPTINQTTAEMNKSKEPRITLKRFRSGKHLGYEKVHHEQIFFGMYGVHNKYDVEIKQGDSMNASFKK